MAHEISDVSNIMGSVRTAQRAWMARSPNERAAQLKRVCQSMLDDISALAEILVAETHKPLGEAYAGDLLGVGDLFQYWTARGPKLLAPRKVRIPKLDMPGKRGVVEREAHGVVAVISPWNYPVALPLRAIVPALLAGNAVILKPSEATPKTGAWLADKLRAELGDVVYCLQGDGQAGAALIEARPDLVHFTGSAATGKIVAVRCAELGIPCEQELGGKDCAVVLDDVALDRAVRGITWGIVHHAGQDCASIERVVVHASVAKTFIPALTAAMAATTSSIPHLVTTAQRGVVLRHLQDASDRGATFLTGGLPSGDSPIPPTLISGLPRDALAWREESFGPIAVIEVCPDDTALIQAANDCVYGLGGSVWGRDLARAERVGRQMNTGMLWVNNHAFTGAIPDAPWVGRGASGHGITSSPELLYHLTRPRLVVVDSASSPEPWWYPYGESMVDLMKAVVRRQREGGLAATLATLGALTRRNKALKKQDETKAT